MVFDDQVGYERIRDIPLLFLTGRQLSAQAVEGVRGRGRSVRGLGAAGSPCGLAENWTSGVAVVPAGQGRYVFTDDFAAPEAVAEYQAWIAKKMRFATGLATTPQFFAVPPPTTTSLWK